MTKSEKALEYFNDSYNCSQSVLTPFSQELGLSENDCLKVACAFGGGMGRQQHTCGAVTGALMVLGMKYGKAFGDDESKKVKTYAKTVEFFKAFESKHGSINCKELLQGLNMNDEADMMKIRELNLFRVKCDKYVADAVEILETMIK
jgi:C_GCAxxG_C_C family probable redox protein